MTDGTAYSAAVISFVAGGIAGAGVALLLAPHAGRQTRDEARRRLHDADHARLALRERVVERCEEMRAEATRHLEEADALLTGSAAGGRASL